MGAHTDRTRGPDRVNTETATTRRVARQDTPEANAFERIAQRAWANASADVTDEDALREVAEERRKMREERRVRGR